MNYKYQFNTDKDKQDLIDTHPELVLREVQKIQEGNYIIFSDTPSQEDMTAELLTNSYANLVKQGVITKDKIKNAKIKSKVDNLIP